MMKYVVLAICLGVASAVPVAPQLRDEEITIVRSENTQADDGSSYKYNYELSDGTKVEQAGALKQIGTEQGIAVQGSYSYTDKASQTPFSLTYQADENGFQPEGQHLPKHFQLELHPAVAEALVLLFRIAEEQRAAAARGGPQQ